MIHLLPISRIITYIAVAYAIFPAAFLYATWPEGGHTLYSAIKLSLSGAGALSVLLFFFFKYGWRLLWRLLPWLNASFFPDLNGKWNMRIEWNRAGKSGTKEAIAIVRQDFLKLSMEVHSADSDSETQLAQPSRDAESGAPGLFYVYRVTPKRTAGAVHPTYLGTATLKVSPVDPHALEGNYFTDAKTQGHFRLTRRVETNSDPLALGGKR